MRELDLSKFSSFIHFGLTSQDINNTALPIMIKHSVNNTYTNHIKNILKDLNEKAIKWRNIVIILKTHGQPATPTTFGKELCILL